LTKAPSNNKDRFANIKNKITIAASEIILSAAIKLKFSPIT